MNSGTLAAGQIFHGRYEIVRCLKTGGMGAVYECVHLKTRKRRALKVMLPEIVADASMRERFELEARVTADIESEHIVETFDAGVDEETGSPFLVMELLRGEELSSLLKRRGALPFEEIVLLLSQAARALDRTHAAGIVHRDLKPDNFFVTMRDDDTPRLKILDFGIAKVIADRSGAVQQTAAIGTPLYMSPEQFQGDGKIGPRADLYALGHIAYALLTGRPYWYDEKRSNPAIFAFCVLVMNGPPELPTARAARRGVVLPGAIDAWFARATAMRPDDRFARASTLVTELAAALEISSPRFSMASLSGLPPKLSVSPEGPSTETSRSAPTKQLLKVDEASRTIVETSPRGALGKSVTMTELDLTSGSTARNPPLKPSKSRGSVLKPVLVLVLGIGLMVLVKLVQGGVKDKALARSMDAPPVATSTAPAALPATNSAVVLPVSAVPVTPSVPLVQSATVPEPPLQAASSVTPRLPTSNKTAVAKQPDPNDPYGNEKPAEPTDLHGAKKPADSDDPYYDIKVAEHSKPSEVKAAPEKMDCTLPYSLDEKGHRHVKLGCN